MIDEKASRTLEGRPTILLTFATVSWQKGSAAQVESLVGELRELRPDLRFLLLSHCPEIDGGPAQRLGIEVVSPGFTDAESRNRRSVAMLWNRLVASAVRPVARKSRSRRHGGAKSLAEAYRSADLVIDLSGDSYRDRPGGFALAHHANFLVALRSGRPYVLASQSIGPFWPPNRPLARYFLNRAEVVYIRERRTKEILNRLGVEPGRIHLAPDVAFALPPAHPAEVWSVEGLEPGRLARPWVGVSASHLAIRLARGRHGNKYLEEMVRTVEHLHRRYGATVLLVPHEVNPTYYGPDDRSAAEAMWEHAGRPSWMHPIRGDYAASTLKGLIAECDALIASRMHAGIAGLSSGIPTVLAAWSHKYHGLMEEIGLGEFVWDQGDDTLTDLPSLFDRLWYRRAPIRRHLLDYAVRTRQEIRAAIRRVAECIPGSTSEMSAHAAPSPRLRRLP